MLTTGATAAVILAPLALFLALRPFSIGHVGPILSDAAVYTALGKALASGHGYYEIWRPTPVPHAYYPPGFPAILAGVWRAWPAFPNNLLLAQLLALASFLVFLWRSQRFCARFLGVSPWEVGLGGLIFATNYITGRLAYGVGSDPLAALLAVEALALCTAVITDRNASRGAPLQAAGLSAVIAGAIYLRSVNVTLLVGCVLALVVARRLRVVAIVILVQLALQAPWVLWVATHRERGSYVSQLVSTLAGPGTALHFAWNSVVALSLEWIPRATSTLFVSERFCSALTGALPLSLPPRLVCAPFSGVVTLLTVYGVVQLLRRSRCLPLMGLMGSLLVVLLPWPATAGEALTGGHAARFLLPIMPFLIAGMVTVVTRGAERVWAPRRAGMVVVGLFTVLAIVPNAGQTLYYSVPLRRDLPILQVSERTNAEIRALLDWVRAETPPEAVIVSFSCAVFTAPSVYLYAARHALDTCYGDPPARLAGQLPSDRPRYYVRWGEQPPLAHPTDAFSHAEIAWPGFTLCYRTPLDGARVYVTSEDSAGSPSLSRCPPPRGTGAAISPDDALPT